MNSVGRILLQALVLGALASAPAYAQSEFAGERFPYRAFDRLPKTTIAIGGGTLDVGFAPGAFTLPRSALMALARTIGESGLGLFWQVSGLLGPHPDRSRSR